MVLVAVAGGTSPTLGKSIVEAILATNKHKAIILSRAKSSNASPPSSSTRYGAPIHHVDYDSIESLTPALEGVDTVISVLKMVDVDAMLRAHTNLLAACQSAHVSRFIMSDWAMGRQSHDQVDILAHKAKLLQMCARANTDPACTVSCCTIQVGMFMNYFAQGSARTKNRGDGDASENQDRNQDQDQDQELTGGLVDDFMLEYIDIAHSKLLIPVSAQGTPTSTSTTHLLDIGRLVALSLDLPPHTMHGALGLTSQDITFAEVRDILGARCGMAIAYRTISRGECDAVAMECGERAERAMQQGKFDKQGFMGRMVAQMVAVMCDEGGGVVEPSLNRLLREYGIRVETRRVEDLVVNAWK